MDIGGPHPPDPRANKPPIGNKWLIDLQIAALADSQHGVVAARQLAALGVSRHAISHRAHHERLRRLHHGVYAAGHKALTPNGYRMAAALACGPAAVISHRTAAAMHELRQTSQTRIDVTVPSSRRQRAGIRLHPGALARDDITTHDGIPITTVSRTLVDLATVLTPDQLLRTIEQAERMHALDLHALNAALERVPRRRGTPALRELLAAYSAAPPTRSSFERDFLHFVERAGLPRPLVNATVAGYEVDIYWPQYRLAIELDSRGYHSSPRSFETDRIRDAKLLRAGVPVLRITYRRFYDDPQSVLDDILALIARAA